MLEDVLGKKPLYVREGGSIPAMAMFKKHLGIETTVLGFGLDDDFIHAPNERCGVRLLYTTLTRAWHQIAPGSVSV